jgi:hypothetical protein
MKKGTQMENDIAFNAGGYEMLRLCSNGDIFIRGQLTTNDCQVVEGLKEWLKAATKVFGNSSIVTTSTIAKIDK